MKVDDLLAERTAGELARRGRAAFEAGTCNCPTCCGLRADELGAERFWLGRRYGGFAEWDKAGRPT